ncbi:hypothetical protein [Paracoccus spongiarum]|uniref:Lipoprotein n=1 Tax=Paracoccus spongiarum TaxID=3064387 RepID=A0ABT9J978_9RHOB|nr:hypothetical protein [Paracoccus sp. 2205BS29-5]MDP5306180.1 hypothetical protein [Paracoccus sp. 2205BS29-5]
MRVLTGLIFTLLLAACASQSPDMFGGERREVVVEGRDFVVFHKATEAEVVRMGYLGRAQRVDVPAQMAMAAAQATGCVVIPGSMTTRIPGDSGVARFDLDCG